MSKPKSAGTWNPLPRYLTLALLAVSAPLDSAERLYSQEASQQRPPPGKRDTELFSGPQPGETLPPLKVRIVIGDNAGRDVALVSDADGKPVFLIFMNEWNEQVAELMRVITLYAEQRENPQLVAAVVWLTSDPSDLKSDLERARPHMPRKTPIGISLDGPEGPGAYGLNRHVQMTILVADSNVVTANFALVQPSIQADSVAVLSELVKIIGGRPPTLAEVITPRNRQIVATRLELMLDESTSDDRVGQLATVLERFVRSRRDAKVKLGQMSKEIVERGEFDDRTPAIDYLRKWAKEYESKH